MTKYRTEYRINKKGRECFRSENFEEVKTRFDKLSANRSDTYTIESRSLQLDRYGVGARDCVGNPLWTCWH